jgi:hypothetical protein
VVELVLLGEVEERSIRIQVLERGGLRGSFGEF